MKYKVTPLTGDASFRKFFRIYANKKSKILIYATKNKKSNLIDYININSFLRKNNICAPKHYYSNIKKGVIEIEDFGSISFFDVVSNTKNKLVVYKKIIDLLIKIQKIKINKKIKIKKYSLKKLEQESNIFFDWYVPSFKKKDINKKMKKKLKKELINIYKKINFKKKYFVHRDFHISNLMKFQKKIGVIDTQDALVGNPSYDVASLIDDVRIVTSLKLKQQILDYYFKKSHKSIRDNKKDFMKDFNILAVQRMLKIIGIFIRLDKRDNKKQYIKFLPYAWKLLKFRLKAQDFFQVKPILKKFVNQEVVNKIL